MAASRESERALLLRVARRAMVDRGLEPDFPPAALAEAAALSDGASVRNGVQDLRALLWCSIDNDDSRDLDQLTVADAPANGCTRVRVAVADVSSTVASGSALDRHARVNTTSVYTPPRTFSMLPDRLSTDLTSLNPDVDRLAVVVETAVGGDGVCGDAKIYSALVHNHAKLAYPAVGAWLQGEGPMPAAVAAVAGLGGQPEGPGRRGAAAKDAAPRPGRARARNAGGARRVRRRHCRRARRGEAEPREDSDRGLHDRGEREHRALPRSAPVPVLRRVVRSPERWKRIVALAADFGETLPEEPDAPALNAFLLKRRAADPLRFPDLSLTIVKLLGRGEYVASFPGQTVLGHFGLAVSEYTHSTAPNRRYPDLVTQRLVHAALAGQQIPYGRDELGALAMECTLKEDAAQKVERLVRKAAAACLLRNRIDQRFDGVVTGASAKGTWVRIFDPPVEGRPRERSRGAGRRRQGTRAARAHGPGARLHRLRARLA